MNDTPSTLTGVYSNTGFDMIQLLSRLISRPNPQIQLGPIDFSCSFVVSDANQPDCPVVYCSPAFETLTGYKNQEIVGKNCRFLQSPDGQVICGAKRKHTDNQAVYYLKSKIIQGMEHQASIINYKKGGQPFVNLVTVIPLFDTNHRIEYFVGLQVDLVEQPNSILEKMKDGTYIVNYHQTPTVPKPLTIQPSTSESYFQEVPALLEQPPIDPEFNKILINNSVDFIHVISLKGTFLYASESCQSLLEYTPEELLGTTLSSICHPSDIIPVMREIKETSTDINLIFRIRRKHSGYMWFESRGSLHMDQSKSRKCLILAGRQRPVYELNAKGTGDGYWAKLSEHGLFLHVTESCKEVVGFTAQSLAFESIYQYTESTTDITNALHMAKQGTIMTIAASLLTVKGTYLPVFCTFYPQTTFTLLHVTTTPSTVRTSAKNLFEELETTRSTNWQYELYQLQQQNKKLKEQLEQYSTKKRKRKVHDTHKMCAFCQRQDSPEWRKGPNGPKELCNACGLKYAKSCRQQNLLIKS